MPVEATIYTGLLNYPNSRFTGSKSKRLMEYQI